MSIKPTEQELRDDFESPELLISTTHQKRISARIYLKNTDWYVTRKTETGKAIPSDIATKRAQARIDADGDPTDMN